MSFSRLAVTALSWGLLSVTLSRGALIYDVADIPDVQYDFIIIGGGASGNVVANRLSENPKHQVLVLEAGPTNEGVLNSEVPFFDTQMSYISPWTWNYTTEPQPGMGGRTLDYTRGHILGGSSSSNVLVYTRGSSEDYDRYAAVSGDQGWSWQNILPYFMKSERWTAPADNHNITGQFDPAVHGFNGEVAISLPGRATPIDGKVMEASAELGGVYTYNVDTNSGHQLGLGWGQNTIKVSERSSSATAYLAPQFLSRGNLHIVVNVHVSRVLQTSRGGVPSFRGVEFRASSGGPLKTLTAQKEVVLSAGSIGTPRILLSSGIGNATSLRALGITPLVDLSDVGENLSDHVGLLSAWAVSGNDTFESLRNDPVAAAEALQQWTVNRTGPYISNVLSHVGFARLDEQLVPANDPAAGPNTAHYEFITSNGVSFAPGPPSGHYYSMLLLLLSPESRGSVKLASSDPFDAPLIDPGYLGTDFDKRILIEATKSIIKFASAPAWSGYILERTGAFADVDVDDEATLLEYITNNSGAGLHAVGTASMSPRGASHGVVDPDLRVKKVDGLRVVDVSVLPFCPSAHTVAAAYAVGERASDLIKAAYV